MKQVEEYQKCDLLRWMDEVIEEGAFSEGLFMITETDMPMFRAIRDRLKGDGTMKKADLSRAAARIEDDPLWKVAIGREMSIITGPGFEARVTGPQHEEAACVMAQADDLLNCMEDIEKKIRNIL